MFAVKCIDTTANSTRLTKGKNYTVTHVVDSSIEGYSDYLIEDDNGTITAFPDSLFIIVPSEPMPHLHPVLQEALDRDFPFTVLKKNNQIVFRFEGFYKSGTVDLVPAGANPFNPINNFVANSRYDNFDEINTWDDLVFLNWKWWDRSKTRSSGWTNPDPKWAEEMVRLNIVTKKTETVTTYESTR